MFEEATHILLICQQYPQRICENHKMLRVKSSLNLHVSVVSYSVVHRQGAQPSGCLYSGGRCRCNFLLFSLAGQWMLDLSSKLTRPRKTTDGTAAVILYLYIFVKSSEQRKIWMCFLVNAGLNFAAAHKAFIWTAAPRNLPRSAPPVCVCGRVVVITVGPVCVLLASLTLASLQGNESALWYMNVLFSKLNSQLSLCTSVDWIQVYVLVPFRMLLARMRFVGMSIRLSLLAF